MRSISSMKLNCWTIASNIRLCSRSTKLFWASPCAECVCSIRWMRSNSLQRSKLNPVAGNPQLVFALRVKGPTTILHVTDLTSFAKGKRVEPDSTAAIDPNSTLTEVKASILYPSKPRTVTAVPGDTSVSYEWREGRLYLTFRNLKVHAAALIEP